MDDLSDLKTSLPALKIDPSRQRKNTLTESQYKILWAFDSKAAARKEKRDQALHSKANPTCCYHCEKKFGIQRSRRTCKDCAKSICFKCLGPKGKVCISCFARLDVRTHGSSAGQIRGFIIQYCNREKQISEERTQAQRRISELKKQTGNEDPEAYNKLLKQSVTTLREIHSELGFVAHVLEPGSPSKVWAWVRRLLVLTDGGLLALVHPNGQDLYFVRPIDAVASVTMGEIKAKMEGESGSNAIIDESTKEEVLANQYRVAKGLEDVSIKTIQIKWIPDEIEKESYPISEFVVLPTYSDGGDGGPLAVSPLPRASTELQPGSNFQARSPITNHPFTWSNRGRRGRRRTSKLLSTTKAGKDVREPVELPTPKEEPPPLPPETGSVRSNTPPVPRAIPPLTPPEAERKGIRNNCPETALSESRPMASRSRIRLKHLSDSTNPSAAASSIEGEVTTTENSNGASNDMVAPRAPSAEPPPPPASTGVKGKPINKKALDAMVRAETVRMAKSKGAHVRSLSAASRRTQRRRQSYRDAWAVSPKAEKNHSRQGIWLDRKEVLSSLRSQRLKCLENRKAVWKLKEKLKKEVTVTVDWKMDDHEKLLKRLWSSLKPSRQWPGRKNKEWSSIGFQGSDPQTDFRGGGLLSLRALVYWAENHSEEALNILKSQPKKVENQYPVCTAGIAISAHLTTFLGIPIITLSNTTIPKGLMDSELAQVIARSVGPNELDAEGLFFELFSVLMKALDSRW
eukprot:CAMPEP_0114530040 /NCGR_PEP_ID=MMETSP0109-20121206/25197_1 /TAXON_ID=29199 /ORGANISM="Chlorarachnion reptans, Strain CCCM449" /LENGTH=743 /DNA_ID=CAMNT_0001712565 /DNA_START=97 /DNA_END=2325 /DNA_ORIENTATION=+